MERNDWRERGGVLAGSPQRYPPRKIGDEKNKHQANGRTRSKQKYSFGLFD
jgi:hypothetical protein